MYFQEEAKETFKLEKAAPLFLTRDNVLFYNVNMYLYLK